MTLLPAIALGAECIEDCEVLRWGRAGAVHAAVELAIRDLNGEALGPNLAR